MKSLKEIIKEASNNKIAIGHFNVSNIEGLWGVFNAARELNLPVIIGVSEGERKFIGTKQISVLVKSLREEFDYPIYCNADHCKSFESLKEAVDADFDAVIFDGASLPIDENIRITKKCVEYAKSVNSDILVEGELGYIGTSSKMLDQIPEGVEMTSVKDAEKFVNETGVDLFASAVGNIHGMLKVSKNPDLNIERINQIKLSVNIPLVLHGGSGVSNEDFVRAIEAGISIININTEIRKSFRESLDKSLKDNFEEITPYKIMKPVVDTVKKVVKNKLKLFSKNNKF